MSTYQPAQLNIGVMAEAMVRLGLLREKGPTSEAFTFRHPFPEPYATQDQAEAPFEDECPAA